MYKSIKKYQAPRTKSNEGVQDFYGKNYKDVLKDIKKAKVNLEICKLSVLLKIQYNSNQKQKIK